MYSLRGVHGKREGSIKANLSIRCGFGGFFLNSAAALSFVTLFLYYNLVLANTSIEKKTILFLLI